MNQKLKNIKNKILDILFPKHLKCMFCSEELTETAVYDTCSQCFSTLPFITHPCARCGEQVADNYSSVCLKCKTNNHNFVIARGVLEYTNKIVALVHKFKYNNKTYLAEPMVNYMAELYAKLNIFPDIVCDVPMHKDNLRKRKFNHSTLLAKTFAEKFNLTYLPVCEKVVNNKSQTSLSFAERKINVKDVYAINKTYAKEIKGKTILIIDDVITTCATIDEVAKTLIEHGAKEVYALSFARTNVNRET